MTLIVFKVAATGYLRNELRATSAQSLSEDLYSLLGHIDRGKEIAEVLGEANTNQIADELMIDR
jgi:hypothetical protein